MSYKLATKPVVNQAFYSSELSISTFAVDSCEQMPGTKWAAKKFSSGIHASAANERFVAMRDAGVDKRPFAGAPYAPSNTFITTGRYETSASAYPEMSAFSTEKLAVEPKAPAPLPMKLTLAQLLASR